MTREIRVTVDDDEVFERMKRRKRELDLSWEEVLRRGLQRGGGRLAARGAEGEGVEISFGPGAGEGLNPFADDFQQRLKRQIVDSVQESVPGYAPEEGAGPDPDPLDEEIDRLEEAEDATLAFPFLDDDPGNRVPLRVNLRTSAEGLDVEVVAVRRGKAVSGTNRFAADARQTVVERLARGESAHLRLRGGAETYEVAPVLSWARDEDGRPTVVDVEIDAVRVGEE